MPRERRANIGRRTRHASQQQVYSRNLREERQNIIRENDRLRHRVSTRRSLASYNRLAFQYDPTANYSDDENLDIGRMTTICRYCNALKFKRETVGLCCASGKVKLDPLLTPPQPLKTLFDGSDPDSSHFLQHILEYNNCFPMTSFGANIIREGGFMPTCKIQGQIYHLHGSMVPTPDEPHQFLQIYFISSMVDQLNVRCNIQGAQQLKRRIIEQLQAFFHANNAVVNMFKTALERMPSDTHKFVIRADCTPTGEHVRRFNAPTVNDVAAIIVGDPTKSRDIVVQRRSNIMHRVNETHRLYDALQYPIIYWQGQDGYDITLKMVDPITGVSTNNKNLSAMNYYAYRMMIRTHEENIILKCGRLFQQFAVDMYVKVETERLAFIRFNQPKLRSEDYIHLRDAIHSDGDVQNIGRLTVLPSTYIGSPRHMHEYAQDAMTYVRNYGTPDLFITVTCNPKWTEIERELEPGQKPQDRHDIIARVFQQKLKVMMDVLTKYRVFGDTRCYMYSVEWQKRGLPHAHILIWLLNKLHSNEVDDIISAEIPDPVTDPRLHDIVTTQMVHGPCGALNPLSPCMADGKCTKRYPRPLVAETVTGNDGYPVYRRRSKEDNGRTIKVKVQNQEIEIGNEFIVPYCPLLSRIFETHANVESCHSAKSIKYLCKYVTKGSDMAVFGIASENVNDEISNFQMGRYEFVRNNVPLLNEQQKQVYETLMQAVDNNTGGLFFLDAPGGTGKTFVISLILATIRSRCDIALALASSGIAATLLDGGRTAHSALKLPLNLNTIDTLTCNISRSSAMGKLLMQCKLIVWDECTMAHKKSLEALNFTLKDLRRNNNIFGGLMILLAGDFRQTLPVVPRGTPADELNACLKASPLWNNVKTLSLTTNMRVQLQNDQSAAQFSKQLLDLGNGKVPVDATSGLITLTNDFCRFVDTQLVLIENVFPNISENYKNYAWLSQRAILAAKNNDVHALNFTIQSKIAGDLVTYKSVDSITNPDDVVNYPTEFLNSLEIPGFPPHNLQLKVGTVIMILRNLNPPRLCNGTRLSVKRLMPNLIEATIINGKYAGENVCIPRIPMIPTDLPFDFKRLQFPVRLAFAMTINKSQGQSLSVCGINLENHCFSHEQLYVACSRVGKPSALFVLTSDQKTKNVVYQRALQ
ncbi:hypothetical protein QTP88_029901 [Uroleucon formosanum]